MNQEDIAAIIQERDTLRHILNYVPAHIFWTDVNGKCLGCNDSLAKICGFNSAQELIGKNQYDILPQEVVARIRSVDEKILTTNQANTIEEDGINVEGEPAIYLSRKAPLQDNKGNTIGIIGISHDITFHKQNTELKIKNEIYIEKLNAMHTLACSLAHEIRTPLAGIKAGIKVFEQLLPHLLLAWQNLPDAKKPLGVDQKIHHLEEVVANNLSLLNYANSTLDITLQNIKQNNFVTTHYHEINISDLIRNSVALYPCSGSQKKKFILELNTDFTFFGDETLMQQVLWNLYKNALYAIQASDGGQIYINTQIMGKQKIISVKDTGIGIEKSFIDNLFTKFHTSKEFGNGLGLAFCKAIIDSFGGKIICESDLGQFTEFKISFPMTTE